MDDRFSTFVDEADAYAQCEAAGYTAHKFDFPAEENEAHWHDFDSLTFITSGVLTIFDVEKGVSYACGAGTKIIGQKGFAHREKVMASARLSVLLKIRLLSRSPSINHSQ